MDPIGNVRHPLKAAWPPSRFQLPYTMRLSHGCVLFGLLSTLGLLAFFFSVVSPYDDDVQQEFVKAKSRSNLSSRTAKLSVQFILSVRTKSGPHFFRNDSRSFVAASYDTPSFQTKRSSD